MLLRFKFKFKTKYLAMKVILHEQKSITQNELDKSLTFLFKKICIAVNQNKYNDHLVICCLK